MNETVSIDCDAGPVADAVLARLVGAVAAQTTLPIDRIADARLVIDAVTGALSTDRISATLTPRDAGIELTVGPLADGEADALLDASSLPEVGSVVRALTDRVWVEAIDDHDYLRFLIDGR